MFGEETRLDRANQIKNTVMNVRPGIFVVPSQVENKKAYIVEAIYTCGCKDHEFHPNVDCKHILAVKLNQKEVI
jgi:predicted nucleic acid-binding Zn finger protein